MKIKPGDLFRWVYKYDNSPTRLNEELYSHTMEKWVPCAGMCLCIGINENIIHWVSDKGLFHTYVDKIRRSRTRVTAGRAIPRKIQL